MITDRDTQVLDFIERFKIATTSQIEQLYYPSNRVARNRLNTLFDAGMVKRDRSGVSLQYEYYKRKPAQYRHCLMLTEFYCLIHKQYEMCKFLREPGFGSIRPDGFVGYVVGGKQKSAFIEIELSHKGFDLEKYLQFYLTGEYLKFLPKHIFSEFPEIWVVSDLKIPTCDHIKIVRYDTKLERMG